MKVLLTSDMFVGYSKTDWWYCLSTVTSVVLDAARFWLVVLSLNCDQCCVGCSKILAGGTVSELQKVLCWMQQD